MRPSNCQERVNVEKNRDKQTECLFSRVYVDVLAYGVTEFELNPIDRSTDPKLVYTVRVIFRFVGVVWPSSAPADSLRPIVRH